MTSQPDRIAELRAHVMALINDMDGGRPTHCTAMAKSKLGELIFWLRAQKAREQALVHSA